MNKFFNIKISNLLLLCMVMTAFLISVIYFFNEKQHMSIQKNKKAVVTLIEEVWSKGNLQIVDQLIAPQYTIRYDPGDPWEGKTLDLTTFKERVKMSRHVFPDQRFYIEDLVGEGDKYQSPLIMRNLVQ